MEIASYASKLTAGSVRSIEFRQHFFLSIDFFSIIIISTVDFLNRISISISFYHRFYTDQISTVDFFEIKRSFRQHLFLSFIYTDQHLIS